MAKETGVYISWDFDDTLYDTKSQKLNSELVKIFNEQKSSGLNVCIVTLRSYEECSHVRYFFPDVRIFYTNGRDKVRYLKYHCPVKIVKHYDDRMDTCRGLIGSDITPVWVFGERVKADMNRLNIIHFREE